MALSVLTLRLGEKSHGLYDSVQAKFIMAGTQDELYEWKHKIETEEQQAANKDYMDNLLKERTDMLILGGNTPEQATEFLKTYMPFLFLNSETNAS